ncbi:MAG: hypothetical protein ACYC7D_14135 [Nitrososphaerales archaeon]
MVAEPNGKEQFEAYEEVKRQYYEYENQRESCISLKEYIENILATDYAGIRFKAWMEPELVSKANPEIKKSPDLLICIGSKWVALDYKEIKKTASKETCLAHIRNLSEYQQEFVFGHRKPNGSTTETVSPEVALVCPEDATALFRDIVTSISIIAFKLGTKMRLRMTYDRFQSRELSKLFSRPFEIDQRDDRMPKLREKMSTIIFLRNGPLCLTYTALVITNILPTMGIRMGSELIETTPAQIAERLRAFYPTYLKNNSGLDIEQVTLGRVEKTLKFLNRINYIRFKSNRIVEYKRSKGKGIDDLLEYFFKYESRIRWEDRKKEGEKKQKEEIRKTRREEKERKKEAQRISGQLTFDDFVKR